jgi:hypothetical protein
MVCGSLFKYTSELYILKLQSIISLERKSIYNKNRIAILDWMFLIVLRYVSSITFFLEKEEIYTKR